MISQPVRHLSRNPSQPHLVFFVSPTACRIRLVQDIRVFPSILRRELNLARIDVPADVSFQRILGVSAANSSLTASPIGPSLFGSTK
ncbi:hypothetical protein FQN52_000103 [Onygenales sp. PD_12]|nr:hypothetical protein FQN52_000103 [Onygenales sp. PD_12]KAK2806948.1 hypothetical protein FQN51_005750 [Onygenales sp. PD_10]